MKKIICIEGTLSKIMETVQSSNTFAIDERQLLQAAMKDENSLKDICSFIGIEPEMRDYAPVVTKYEFTDIQIITSDKALAAQVVTSADFVGEIKMITPVNDGKAVIKCDVLIHGIGEKEYIMTATVNTTSI